MVSWKESNPVRQMLLICQVGQTQEMTYRICGTIIDDLPGKYTVWLQSSEKQQQSDKFQTAFSKGAVYMGSKSSMSLHNFDNEGMKASQKE